MCTSHAPAPTLSPALLLIPAASSKTLLKPQTSHPLWGTLRCLLRVSLQLQCPPQTASGVPCKSLILAPSGQVHHWSSSLALLTLNARVQRPGGPPLPRLPAIPPVRLARPSQRELPEFRHTARLGSTPTPARCPQTPPVRAGADSQTPRKVRILAVWNPTKSPALGRADKATHSESVPRTPGIHTAPSRPNRLTLHPDTLTHSHPPPQTLHPRRYNRSGRGGPGPSRCHPPQSAQLSHPASSDPLPTLHGQRQSTPKHALSLPLPSPRTSPPPILSCRKLTARPHCLPPL